jgi:hypothetical protein
VVVEQSLFFLSFFPLRGFLFLCHQRSRRLRRVEAVRGWHRWGRGTVGEMEIESMLESAGSGKPHRTVLAEACLTLLWREATCPCHLSAATYDHDSEVMAGLETSEVYRERPVRVGCLS